MTTNIDNLNNSGNGYLDSNSGRTETPSMEDLNASEAGDQDPGVDEVSDGADQTPESQLAKAVKARQNRALQLSAVQKAVAFTQIVSLLMRSQAHKQHALSDIEWLVLPPLQLGQYRIAETKTDPNALSVPAGFVFWASVSPEVDQRLSKELEAPIRLKPDEWNSGEILWLVEMLGDPRALRALLRHFKNEVPEGASAKVRTTSPEGKVTVSVLGALQLDEAPSTPGAADLG